MLHNVFPMYTGMQKYHLKYPNVLRWVLNNFSLNKLCVSMKSIVSGINGRDTSRPLGK